MTTPKLMERWISKFNALIVYRTKLTICGLLLVPTLPFFANMKSLNLEGNFICGDLDLPASKAVRFFEILGACLPNSDGSVFGS